jgi:phage terminase small subunit
MKDKPRRLTLDEPSSDQDSFAESLDDNEAMPRSDNTKPIVGTHRDSRFTRPRAFIDDSSRVEQAITNERDQLSEVKKKFAQEFLLDFDPFKAAERAGARNPLNGLRWYSDPAVRREIERLKFYPAQFESRHYLFQRVVSTTLHYVNEWMNADRIEILQLRRVNCRYCWGENNDYQYTHAEMEQRLRDHAKARNAVLFDKRGGAGFDYTKNPNPDCPNCFGNGDNNPEVRFMDWRTASKPARDMVKSVQSSKKYGLRIEFHSKMEIVHEILRSLHYLAKQFELTVDDPANMTEDTLQQNLMKIANNMEVTDPELQKYLEVVLPKEP